LASNFIEPSPSLKARNTIMGKGKSLGVGL
jgi:hypothetical protein